jgi:hypothetical protein
MEEDLEIPRNEDTTLFPSLVSELQNFIHSNPILMWGAALILVISFLFWNEIRNFVDRVLPKSKGKEFGTVALFYMLMFFRCRTTHVF